jgi:hypothetical protein
MKIHRWLAGAALCFAAVAAVLAASAQSLADTTELADAVARVIGDSLLPRLRSGSRSLLPHQHRGDPMFVAKATTDFDARVVRTLQEVHRLPFLKAQADTALWVGTRGATVRGDTAAVLVEVGTRRRPAPANFPIHTYVETSRYLFVRAPRGWRFVRREFVRGADIGSVRG